MSSRTSAFGVLAFAIGGAALATSAYAADLTAPYDPGPAIQQPVEFGSGWYIRGDIGYERLDASTSPSAPQLSGGVPVDPPVAPSVRLSSGNLNSYSAGIGGGYQFNNWIRADGIVEMRRPLASASYGPNASCINGFSVVANTTGPYAGQYPATTESCSPVSKTNVSRYDALANAYFDLGTWSGITPYVGAGVGAAFGRQTGQINWYQQDGTSYNFYILNTNNNSTEHAYYDASASKTYVNFAWAVMAGFAYDLTDRLKLDIGYRYFDAGRLTGFAPSGAATSIPLTSQDVRVGLRYMVD